ncbi:hypothetical protein DB346_13185 [Verrucomicrobia bacterium LW23]|nr:hypothetical protein DB346_13185 [Verrucomicrobia bacterium LW23]
MFHGLPGLLHVLERIDEFLTVKTVIAQKLANVRVVVLLLVRVVALARGARSAQCFPAPF